MSITQKDFFLFQLQKSTPHFLYSVTFSESLYHCSLATTQQIQREECIVLSFYRAMTIYLPCVPKEASNVKRNSIQFNSNTIQCNAINNNLYCLRSLLGAAFLPTVQIKQGALVAFPREFLGTNIHVFGKGTIGTVVVLLDERVFAHHQKTAGAGDKDGNLDPQPQFGPFLVVGLVGIGRHDFLLVGDSRPDLFDGLGLHLGLGTNLGDGLNRTELGGARDAGAAGGGHCGASAERQGASEASGCCQRLCFVYFVLFCSCV
jgi:hypothetical protein